MNDEVNDITMTLHEQIRQMQYIPELQANPVAEESAVDQYHKILHEWFMGDSNVLPITSEQILPVLLAPLLRAETSVRYSDDFVFQLLNEQLRYNHQKIRNFLDRIKLNISGLKDLQALAHHTSETEQAHYEFASDIVAFEQVDKLATVHGGAEMSHEQQNLITRCLMELEAAVENFKQNGITVFTTQALASEFDLEKKLSNVRFEISQDPCDVVNTRCREETQRFIRTVAALRQAELLLAQKYDTNLHTTYFERFNISHLTEEDIASFKLLLVIDESHAISRSPGSFINLMSGRSPVKVLAVNRLYGEQQSAESNPHELAALAIVRRRAYVFQGSENLETGLRKGLTISAPVLWNVLFVSTPDLGGLSKILPAVRDSRYFPNIEFDTQSGSEFGSHFNIHSNEQPSAPFPTITLDIKSPTGTSPMEFQLTPADVLAVVPGSQEELHLVPPETDFDDLIEFATYILSPAATLVGKIPFIWVVDESDNLRKAVTPLSWVIHSRSCLEYWQFLQDVGGTHSFHARQAVESERTQWEDRKAREIDDLKKQLTSEVETNREKDLEKAINRMLYAILDPKKGNTTNERIEEALSNAETQPELQDTVTESNQPIVPEGPPGETSERNEVISEVWVETDECTSCNDCIDLLPGVFKYNADKQAIVHNPKGGPYAKIVAAAEKCPARCIHPGLPHNPDEPDLEKFLKRAEKFN